MKRLRLGLGGLLLSAGLWPAPAQEPALPAVVPAAPAQAPEPAPLPAGPITLTQAVQISLERQPTIHAARADLEGVQVQSEAAASLLATLTGPQIHVRRQQAALGIEIATLAVERAELDAVHAVSRTYVSAVLAHEQGKIAREAVDKLKALSQVAKGLVEQGSKEVTRTDLDRIQVYLLLAETRGVEANVGLARALAALREAMGVPPGCPVALADSDLGIYMVTLQNYATANKLALSVEQAVKHAWAHRPDLRQAQLFADMAGLEAEAQRQTHQPYVRTFAATGDIHAPILPAGEINGNYRPGPLGPDMPVYLAGSKDVRVARAQTLFRRALAVVDKAKGLIALQVTEAAERVQQEVQQVDSLRQAVAKSSKLAEESEKFFRADNLSVEKMLNAQLLELQVKAQLNEALFRHATAVATLQNAIAGQVYEAYAPVAPAK